MCKKLIVLCVALVVAAMCLLLTSTARADDYTRTVMADSPLSFWEFEDAASNDGNTCADTVGISNGVYRNLGTGMPEMKLVPGPVGKAAKFNGTGSSGNGNLVQIYDSNSSPIPYRLESSPNVTLELLMKTVPTASENYSRVISHLSSWNDPNNYAIIVTSSGDNPGQPFITGAGSTWYAWPPILADNRWHHVVVTYDFNDVNGTTVEELFIDANSRGRNAVVGVLKHADWQDLKLGAEGNQFYIYNGYVGFLDEVAYYNYVLTQDQITAHFNAIPPITWASEPNPPDGAADVSSTPTLSWLPGRYAASANGHELYFSSNFAEVDNRTATKIVLNDPCYPIPSPPAPLEIGRTYYWCVDEVNNLHPDNRWPGDVWSFTIRRYLIVDDMEKYSGANLVYNTWLDGYGTTSRGGSIIGHDNSPYVETTIIHGGLQSMPFYYDNDGKNKYNKTRPYFSEVEADTSKLEIGSDWGIFGVKSLILYFYGNVDNDANATERMYVALKDNNNKMAVIYYDGDLSDLREPEWHEWGIRLKDFTDINNVALGNVTKVYIGFGNRYIHPTPGGSGLILFDDIGLHWPTCIFSKRSANFAKADYAPPALNLSGDCVVDNQELEIMARDWLVKDAVITPTTNPAIAGGLVAYYPLDEGSGTTTADASGNGNDGTFSASGLSWVLPGLIGNSAIDVNGAPGTRVSLTTLDPVGPSGGFTLSVWAKWGGPVGGQTSQGLIGKRDGWDNTTVRFMFEVFGNNQFRLGEYASNVYSQANIMQQHIGRWTHIALRFNGTTATFYLNGRDVGSGPFTLGPNTTATMTIGNTQSEIAWPGAPEAFNGRLDEVRIYNRVLSTAEIAYLADLTPGDGSLYSPVPSLAELYEGEALGSRSVDLRDFAYLADSWLEKQLWPW